MDEFDDPEVAADAALRARTAQERAPASVRLYDWQHPGVVAYWPCRACQAQVGVTQEALDAANVQSTELAKRREAAIDTDRVVFCTHCREKGLAMQGAANRKAVDRMAMLIRELRGGTTSPAPPGPAPNADREREILDSLRRYGHPDIDGLAKAIREKRDAGSKSTRVRGV